MKKVMALLATVLLAGSVAVFAQEEDDFFIDLSVDLSQTAEVSDEGGAAAAGPVSKVKQGLWVEATGKTQFLIRDIATGEKSGYEVDNAHFKSNANWWFWGELTPKFHLDAEISVWSFDKCIYQSNSYAANVPDVTLGDGVQSLFTIPFSFFNNANDDGVGAFNKMALNVATPYVNIRTGYGQLKHNGMAKFTGIYNVLDRWLDVGKGYTEITNGVELQNIGNIKLDAVAGLSQMRGTFGGYGYVDANYNDFVEGALTFGSVSNAQELFYYNTNCKNAGSVYVAVQPLDVLKVEAHGLCTFGSNVNFGLNSMAAAGRVTLSVQNFNVALKQSVAGKNADSVWGSDGQAYDDINADTYTTQLDLNWNVNNWASLVLDAGLTLNNTEKVAEGLWALRCEPVLDFDFSNLFDADIAASVYGVACAYRPSAASETRNVKPYFEEAAFEVTAYSVIPGINKITFDYGVKLPWSGDDVKSYSKWFNSIMINADVTDSINVHLGSLIRVNKSGAEDLKNVPVAVAAGVSIAGLPLPGSPKLWVHATYGMNPYSENNYSLYRADNELNTPVHRTYLLDDLDADTTTSTIGLGLIWNL